MTFKDPAKQSAFLKYCNLLTRHMSTINKTEKRKAMAVDMPTRMALLWTRKVEALKSIIMMVKHCAHTSKAQLKNY